MKPIRFSFSVTLGLIIFNLIFPVSSFAANKQTVQALNPSTACDPTPLPGIPIEPGITIETERTGNEFYLTYWRYPCNEDFSWVVFTFEPKSSSDRPFICASQLTINQEFIIEDSFKLCDDPIDENCSDKCGFIETRTSYVLAKVPFATSAEIDFNEAFSFEWDFLSSVVQEKMDAYDPWIYGIGEDPGLVNQLAVNGLFYDRGNPGHGFDFNLHEAGLTIFYFGHTDDRERLWLISHLYTERVEYDVPIVLTMDEVVDGTLGAPVLPQTYWGTLTVTLDDCDNGSAILDGLDGRYEMTFSRLVGLKDVECYKP